MISVQVTGHVDDRLDDTIRMVCYEVKCSLGFFHSEVMGYEGININRSTGNKVDGCFCAIVLAADILNAQLLATKRLHPEANLITTWNTDQHHCATRLEQIDCLVKSLLTTSTFKDTVEPVGFLLQDRFHDIPAGRHTGPVGAAAPGQSQSFVKQISDKGSTWTKRTHRQLDTQSNRP